MLHALHRHRVRPARHPWPARPSSEVALDEVEAGEARDALDACDAYVVLVLDPETGALDSYGPLTGADAVIEAERRRRDLDAGDLHDVEVRVVRHHVLRRPN